MPSHDIFFAVLPSSSRSLFLPQVHHPHREHQDKALSLCRDHRRHYLLCVRDEQREKRLRLHHRHSSIQHV